VNLPALLFIDSNGLEQLRRCLPQLEVESDKVSVVSLGNNFDKGSFDLNNLWWRPLPPMEFTRHRLRLAVSDAADQPLLLEAGFLSLWGWVLTERNPANASLPSLTPLRRRALPGVRWSWWPWSGGANPWRQVPGSARSRRTPQLIQGSFHLLSSFNNPNWYHWLTLPGLGSLPANSQSQSLILSDRALIGDVGAFPPLFERVAILAKALTAGGLIKFDRGPLLVKELQASFIENHTSLVCDGVGLRRLRSATLPLAASAKNIITSAKLYLRRGAGSRRPLVQEDRLEKLLLQRGFVVIDAESLSLSECIASFANARWVVAPHGAALANLVFAKPGTRVLELLPGSLHDFGHYALMAAALALNHSHFSGDVVEGGGFRVDQEQILTWLDAAQLDVTP